MRDVDFIIVGQGLAGTCLAWELRALGASFVVIDGEAVVTSSRIAAGLITPVTGQRLVKTWRFEELRPAAWEFYRRVKRELGCDLLRDTAMVKVFATEQEQTFFGKRLRDPAYHGLLRELTDLPVGVLAPRGGCELLQGGQLNVSEFLSETREMLTHEGCYLAGKIALPEDVEFREQVEERTGILWPAAQQALHPPGDSHRVELPKHGLRTKTLVFCEGIAARSNPWFSNVEFNPARGEMLTVRIPEWTEARVIHGGVWIAPLGASLEHERLYRVGATYDWNQLDAGPTGEGRSSLIASLDKLIAVPYEIVDHVTAVRPILKHLNPVIGRHPRYPQLGYFNGLASKGSLQAPYFARQFASHLVNQTPIEREVDLQVRVPWPQ